MNIQMLHMRVGNGPDLHTSDTFSNSDHNVFSNNLLMIKEYLCNFTTS